MWESKIHMKWTCRACYNCNKSCGQAAYQFKKYLHGQTHVQIDTLVAVANDSVTRCFLDWRCFEGSSGESTNTHQLTLWSRLNLRRRKLAFTLTLRLHLRSSHRRCIQFTDKHFTTFSYQTGVWMTWCTRMRKWLSSAGRIWRLAFNSLTIAWDTLYSDYWFWWQLS